MSTSFFSIPGADLGGGGPGPPLTPQFEAPIFAATATPLRDVGKILAGPLPTQILDPHLLFSYADMFCALIMLFEYISFKFMQFLSSGMGIFIENDT